MWSVICCDRDGSVSEFKCQSSELAVEYALLIIELMKWQAIPCTNKLQTGGLGKKRMLPARAACT
jgi:hypothetical protein